MALASILGMKRCAVRAENAIYAAMVLVLLFGRSSLTWGAGEDLARKPASNTGRLSLPDGGGPLEIVFERAQLPGSEIKYFSLTFILKADRATSIWLNGNSDTDSGRKIRAAAEFFLSDGLPPDARDILQKSAGQMEAAARHDLNGKIAELVSIGRTLETYFADEGGKVLARRAREKARAAGDETQTPKLISTGV